VQRRVRAREEQWLVVVITLDPMQLAVEAASLATYDIAVALGAG
jgi:hypothetical protein